jgi:hypothetical protein
MEVKNKKFTEDIDSKNIGYGREEGEDGRRRGREERVEGMKKKEMSRKEY